MGKKLDLTGQKYGRLTVIEEAGRDKHGSVLWRCKCLCGRECVTSANHLRTGDTTSCGCFHRERVTEVKTKHGLHKHPLYGVWEHILRRCGVYRGANYNEYRNYIARGISVCDEWRDFQSFYAWCISHGYEDGLEIDRIDNARGYCPANCRFVTRKQNVNNRRNTTMLCGCSLAMLCSELGIATREDGKKSDMYNRISVYHLEHKGQKVHRDLVFALLRDIEKQENLLAETIAKRKRVEAELERLKASLKS